MTGDAERSGELSSLERGLRILAFVQDHAHLRVADIVDALDIPTSTAYRYVRLLRNAGYLTEVGGKLTPTDRLADRASDDSAHLLDLARPVLGGLRRCSGLNVLLTVRVHTAALCLDSRRSGSGSVAYFPGEILALHAGASATPLLATAPAAIQRQVLDGGLHRFTAATPDARRLAAELEAVRTAGFHVTRGWLTPGMTAVGVPTVVAGTCVCALSIVGTDRELADVDGPLRLLRDAADGLAARLSEGRSTAWIPPPDVAGSRRHGDLDGGPPPRP